MHEAQLDLSERNQSLTSHTTRAQPFCVHGLTVRGRDFIVGRDCPIQPFLDENGTSEECRASFDVATPGSMVHLYVGYCISH